MPARELVANRLGSTAEASGPSDEAIISAYAANLHLDLAQMHRIVTRDPEQLADADLLDLGCTREEAVSLAHEIQRGLGPAYRRVFAPTRRSHGGGVALAARRVGTRARGAGRPGTRRPRPASSSPGGDDGSGSADPEPPSRPARRWALYRQSQPTGGRQRAVIVRLDAASTRRAEL